MQHDRRQAMRCLALAGIGAIAAPAFANAPASARPAPDFTLKTLAGPALRLVEHAFLHAAPGDLFIKKAPASTDTRPSMT